MADTLTPLPVTGDTAQGGKFYTSLFRLTSIKRQVRKKGVCVGWMVLGSPSTCGCFHGFYIQHESLLSSSFQGSVPDWDHRVSSLDLATWEAIACLRLCSSSQYVGHGGLRCMKPNSCIFQAPLKGPSLVSQEEAAALHPQNILVLFTPTRLSRCCDLEGPGEVSLQPPRFLCCF